jgi:hypothetical protein
MGTNREKVLLEDKGTFEGFDYLILRMPMGHLCGYVAIPPSHPFYQKGYCEIEDCYDISVHGGLTFAGPGLEPMQKDTWYLGFDCAHCNDWSSFDPQGHRWTVWEVRQECERLIAQLKDLKPKEGE